MQGYNPSADLLNLYDTTKEKPFEFMHSRSFVNINVATGWTVSKGGQFPYENIITLPVAEGDFPITMEYQPTAIIQPNANESCAPSNFPYIETTRNNQVTLYAYLIPDPTSMLPIVVNLTQNGSPHGSTNASSQRSSIEQTMIQLSQNYFLIEVIDGKLKEDTVLEFQVTAYKGGEKVEISPAPDGSAPKYAVYNQDGMPVVNPQPVGGEVAYPSVELSSVGDTALSVTITLEKDTVIDNGVAIIYFPVQAGTIFYPRATINAIASTEILEQIDSYHLDIPELTRDTNGNFYIQGKAFSRDTPWIIKATKKSLNGKVSNVVEGQVVFTAPEVTTYSQSLSNGLLVFNHSDGASGLLIEDVFKEDRVKVELKVNNKVVASQDIYIKISGFSTIIQSSVDYITTSITTNISFTSYTLVNGDTLVPKYGTLTIYKNFVSEINKLAFAENTYEINYSLLRGDSFNILKNTSSLVATFTDPISGLLLQQIFIPVANTVKQDIFAVIASPSVLIAKVNENNEVTNNPNSSIQIFRNDLDVTSDFDLILKSDGGADFDFDFTPNNNKITITKFLESSSFDIVGVIITATNKETPNIQAIGSIQVVRQKETEVITHYTHIGYTANTFNNTPITEKIESDTKYMGVANTTSQSKPTDKTDYKWTPITKETKEVAETIITYAQNDSGTERPDVWGEFPSLLQQGNYLWTKTKVVYTDPDIEPSISYNVSYVPIDGSTWYTWVMYSDNADGSDFYEKPREGTKYMGISTNQSGDTPPPEPTDYTWAQFKGDRGPAGPVLRIEAPDGLAFSEGQTKSIRLEVKLMDEDINRIDEYPIEGIRWERSSSDSIGDILFASTKQGPSIYIDPEFLNVPATYTCFVSKIVEDTLTINGEPLTNHQSEVISVNTYSPIVYTAHVTTSLEISEEIKKIEKTIENIERNSVTASEFKREQNRLFGSVSEVITTTADLVTRVDGVKDKVQEQVLKQEVLTSELDMTSRRIRGEVKAVSDKGDRQYAYLELKSDEIRLEVSEIDGKVGSNTSKLSVQADVISSKVSADGVISAINQTPEIITIDANKINLTGYVTVSSLSGEGTTTIDGSNIKTGTISANRLELTDYVTVSSLSGEGTTTIDGSNIKTGTISANRLNLTGYATTSNLTTEINSTKSYADTKANTAQSNAKTYTDNQIGAIDGVLKTYTNSQISAFSGGLGDLAFKDKIGTALLDNTIISGGYIKTNLISFNNAVGTNVNLTGTITATDGKIGGFDISSNNLIGTDVSLKPNEITVGAASLQSNTSFGAISLKGWGLAIGSGKNDGLGSWIKLENNSNQLFLAHYFPSGLIVNVDRLSPATLGTNTQIGYHDSRFGSIYLVNQPNVSSDNRHKLNIDNIDPLLIEIFGKEVKPKSYNTKYDDKQHFGYIAQDVERALYKYLYIKYCEETDKLNASRLANQDVSKFALLSKEESYMSLLYGEINVIIEAYHRLQNEKLEERIAVLEKGG